MSYFWEKLFSKIKSRETIQHGLDSTGDSDWNIASRPNHSERFIELQRTLAQETFSPFDPKRNAYFFIAGLLNHQLAFIQAAQILDVDGEACLRTPFALGYIFGLAAWSSEKYDILRPSDEAEELILLAYQEVLGPLSAENISQLSGRVARQPEFNDGIEYGARDAMQFAQGVIESATGLAEFTAKCRSNANKNIQN